MTNWCCCFFLFSHKIGFDSSFKLSPYETICMNCQILLSRKQIENKIVYWMFYHHANRLKPWKWYGTQQIKIIATEQCFSIIRVVKSNVQEYNCWQGHNCWQLLKNSVNGYIKQLEIRDITKVTFKPKCFAWWVKLLADDILIFFFLFFWKKRFYTSCKLPPRETVCMKCQILLSVKNKKTYKQFVVC